MHVSFDILRMLMHSACAFCKAHPDFLMMVIRALSKPHCSKVCTGLGASKPETLIPSCARMLATCRHAPTIPLWHVM